MNVGRAVVGSDAGGIPELIDDGVTGWLVPPGDAAALAEAMAKPLSDRALAERAGAAGAVRARSQFSSDEFVASWTETLRRVLDDP
jgi:glycosyltransferase involved in cell wall biosynthesis